MAKCRLGGDFSRVRRLPGRHRKRCDDVLGAKTGLQRGRSADTKHRNSKKKASIGENVAHMTQIKKLTCQ